MTDQRTVTISGRSLDELVPELRARPQWVCWRSEQRNDEQTKVPIRPDRCTYASVTDERTWTSFEIAREVADVRTDIEGLGFVFTADDPFVGIDLDGCLELATPGPGVVPSDLARSILGHVESYTEISPSHTGLHVIARGAVPESGTRTDGLEVYQNRRFFTVTGSHVRGFPPQVRKRNDELAAVYAEHFEESSGEKEPSPNEDRTTERLPPGALREDGAVDREALVDLARSASNGKKFERLWNGSTAGYRSHSEADMALCTLLAFWTGGDPELMDDLFRRSGLMREKWDVRRGDRTYGELTIRQALEYVDEYYRWPSS